MSELASTLTEGIKEKGMGNILHAKQSDLALGIGGAFWR